MSTNLPILGVITYINPNQKGLSCSGDGNSSRYIFERVGRLRRGMELGRFVFRRAITEAVSEVSTHDFGRTQPEGLLLLTA